MSKGKILLFVLSVAIWSGCRANLPEDDARLTADSSQKIWIDSFGEQGECDPPFEKCSEYDNDTTFINLCVAEGFQAKTCGCSVKCSGAVNYKRERPAASIAPKNDGEGCQAEDLAYFQKIKSTLDKMGDLKECIEDHVCRGHTVGCTPSHLEISRNIRAKARTSCAADAVATFCNEERADTFGCPEPTVDTLSREWRAAFEDDDKQLRTCLQNTICTGKIDRCGTSLKARAESIKAGLSLEGCAYWQGYFCRLGADQKL